MTRTFPGEVKNQPCPECFTRHQGILVLRWSDRYGKPFYGCSRWRISGCTGSIGAHPDGRPLGTPADAATKEARIRAHQVFDAWYQGMGMKRGDAYRVMAKMLGLAPEDAHIGSFDLETCEQLVRKVVRTHDAGTRSGLTPPTPASDHRGPPTTPSHVERRRKHRDR